MTVAEAPLAGRAALVTGASSDIGSSIALRLAAHGADLVLTARPGESLESVTEKIRTAAPERRVLALSCELSESERVTSAVNEAVNAFDKVDILVNNAEITRETLLSQKKEDWDEVLATDLKGMFHACRVVARQMLRRRSGRIVNVTSKADLSGNAAPANCAASRGGVVAFTYTLAKELASRGITVNAVVPGIVARPDATSEDAVADAVDKIPLGRIGEPNEIAALVAFLCGPGGAYITGEVIRVDGGLAIGG